MSEPNIVVIGGHWRERHAELTYVTRAIAGAASRWTNVAVLVTGIGHTEPDGAFDIESIGEGGAYRWPDGLTSDCVVVVDDLTPEVAGLLTSIGPRAVFYLEAQEAPGQWRDPSWRELPLTGIPEAPGPFVQVYIPVNPLAELHRHSGFGFTGYQLVLGDGSGHLDDPPPAAAWLTAAFHDTDVIVVENAMASAWRGRALRGRSSVDSRMDLWRLIAHAGVCIDLAPGPRIARECVEAMRFGTPIVVPADSGAAATHAAASNGRTFADPGELLAAAESLLDDAGQRAASRLGRTYADANYGVPEEFVQSLRAILSGT